MAADDATFKTAMRLLAGGVTIVATSCDGQVSGLTATAVCSLRAVAAARAGVRQPRRRHLRADLQKPHHVGEPAGEGQEDLAQRFAAKRRRARPKTASPIRSC